MHRQLQTHLQIGVLIVARASIRNFPRLFRLAIALSALQENTHLHLWQSLRQAVRTVKRALFRLLLERIPWKHALNVLPENSPQAPVRFKILCAKTAPKARIRTRKLPIRIHRA